MATSTKKKPNDADEASMSATLSEDLDARVRALMGFNDISRKDLQTLLYERLVKNPEEFGLKPSK